MPVSLRRFVGLLCVLLVLLPALTGAWAFRQISFIADDWFFFGWARERLFYNPLDPERPLLNAVFTTWATLTGDQYEVLHLINLWVLPSLAALVLFAALRMLFALRLDGWRAAFLAFLIAALYLVSPINSVRPWLTMIGYHTTHLFFFSALWLWCKASTQNRPIWVLAALVPFLLNALIVEAHTFFYLMMPLALLARPRAAWARRGGWLMVMAVWLATWGGYLYWRLFAFDTTRRAIETPTTISGMLEFIWRNSLAGLDATVNNGLEAARNMPTYGGLFMAYAYGVGAVLCLLIIALFVHVRRQPTRPQDHRSVVFGWLAYGVVGIGGVVASLLPYIAQFGESANVSTFGVNSRLYHLFGLVIAVSLVTLLVWANRLAVGFGVAIVMVFLGIQHHVRVTYEYVRSYDFQHTLWAQVAHLALAPNHTLSLRVVQDKQLAHYGLDAKWWSSGQHVMGIASSSPRSRRAYRLGYVDGQIIAGGQPVRAEDVRFYVLYPDARLVPQATLDFIGVVDGQGQSIPIYTGENRLADVPRLNDVGTWYFGQPYTPTTCWSFAVIQSPDTAPSAGYALIVNEFNGEILDRRPVAEGEVLSYRALLPCDFLMQVQFLTEDGRAFSLDGAGQDRTSGLAEEVTFRPAFAEAWELFP